MDGFPQKIILLGYMGCGKSIVGKALAADLEVRFVDLDIYIEMQEKCSISTLFSSKGEVWFRRREAEYLKALLHGGEAMVLSLGGGTPCYGNNMEHIHQLTDASVYLQCTASTLYERLKTETDKRPLIAGLSGDKLKSFIQKHLFERAPYYRAAKILLPSDSMTVAQCVEAIKSKVSEIKNN